MCEYCYLRVGVWGFYDSYPIQCAENVFLKFILALPNSASVYSCHSELGIPYIADIIKAQPALLWHRIWTSTCTGLNQEILKTQ